jgi:2-iminobutanoate/2-iminopropanoate deaminase
MSDERHWRPIPAAPDAPPPAGAYSPAIRAGDFIFVSGQVPKDPATGRIEGDVAQQTRVVLANLRAVLAAEGASLDDVVSVTAYLADIGEWDAFNTAYSEVFRPPYPTRTTLGAGLHGFKVEINAIAYVGRTA